MAEKILMVGAGAVGQVFAWHFARAGAEVTFWVRPQHPQKPELVLFPQTRDRAVLLASRWLTDLHALQEKTWDQLWLAVPSDTLGGGWLEALLRATGDATVVGLGPETEAAVPPQRRVVGAIPFMAWQHPLPGEQGEPGVAFWIPPLAALPLSGAAARVDEVKALLKRSGLGARTVEDAARTAAPMTAMLMSLVTGLEISGWSIRQFRGPSVELAAKTAREAMAISGAKPWWRWVARGWVLRGVLWAASRVVPFPLETYLKFHFTKVGDQTRVLLRRWIDKGRAERLPTQSIEAMAQAVGAAG